MDRAEKWVVNSKSTESFPSGSGCRVNDSVNESDSVPAASLASERKGIIGDNRIMLGVMKVVAIGRIAA